MSMVKEGIGFLGHQAGKTRITGSLLAAAAAAAAESPEAAAAAAAAESHASRCLLAKVPAV